MKAAIGALILVAGLCVGVMIRADEAPSASNSGPVVTPLERPAGALLDEALAAGFTIERTVMEAEGLCARCREAGA